MTVNIFLQLVSIIFRIVAIAFVASLFRHMKYGFGVILFRLLVRRDFTPLEWLRWNILYVYFLIFEFSQFGFLMGLIHEFSLNQVNTKSWEFFFASPLTSLSTCLIFYELIKRAKKTTGTKSV